MKQTKSIYSGFTRRTAALVAAAAMFMALTNVSPALAAKAHLEIGDIRSFTRPLDVAPDESTENIFVADRSAESTKGVVTIAGPLGGPAIGAIPSPIPGLTYQGTSGIAVDNALSSPSRGAVYVVGGQTTVKKFVLNTATNSYELATELTGVPSLQSAVDVAVGPGGRVYVSDEGAQAVVVFSAEGSEVERIPMPARVEWARTLSVDGVGNIFLNSGSSPNGTYRLKANALGIVDSAVVAEQITTISEHDMRDIAADPGAGRLYVASATNHYVAEYGTDCIPVGTGQAEHCIPDREFGQNDKSSPTHISVNSASGRVYVAFPDSVRMFGPLVSLGDPITGPASAVASDSASLSGTVNPEGASVLDCKFEWGETESNERGSVQCTPPPSAIGTGEQPVPVTGDLKGLTGGRTYHYRLAIANSNGASRGVDRTVHTPGPEIGQVSVSEISDSSATLRAEITPAGAATTYQFQYVPEAQFNQSGYAEATSAPVAPQAIGEGSLPIPVAETIERLQPFTVYHFRAVANSAAGQSVGDDGTFGTFGPATVLPDGRAYEQVSPVQKNGADASGGRDLVHSSPDGNRFLYYSVGAIPGSEGSQRYQNYLATRVDGWQTQGFLPPAALGARALVKGWSDDLETSYSVQAEEFGETGEMYERNSTSRALRAITQEIEVNTDFDTVFAASARNDDVALFESYSKLTPKATNNGQPNLYLWNRVAGTLSLVGVLNNGRPPAGGAEPGGAHREPNTYPYYYVQRQRPLSTDGETVFFSGDATRALYVRTNALKDQSPLKGGACADASLACTTELSKANPGVTDTVGPQPATLAYASPDGTRAIFASSSRLTADATTGAGGGGSDLYLWDSKSSPPLSDLSSSAETSTEPYGAEVQGVLAASDDLSVVYFVANGILADGAQRGDCVQGSKFEESTGSCNLYVRAAGQTRFIARLDITRNAVGMGDRANWLETVDPDDKAGERSAQVSADGSVLMFRSRAKLTAYENAGTPEIYRYSLGNESLQCVSCSPTGEPPVGAASIQNIIPARPPGEYTPILTRNLVAAGNRIYFETPDRLVGADVNGEAGCPVVSSVTQEIRSCQDVYEWEAQGTGSCNRAAQNGGCLYLISSGTSSQPSFFGDASASGDDVFFFTRQPLVPQDQDELVDVYDARVGGGLPSQHALPPTPCVSEGECRGAPTDVQSFPALGSELATERATRRKCTDRGRQAGKQRKHCSKRTKRRGKRKGKHQNRISKSQERWVKDDMTWRAAR